MKMVFCFYFCLTLHFVPVDRCHDVVTYWYIYFTTVFLFNQTLQF